ncbi:MAG: hypothetical protein ACREJC_04110, partial [Tepidisphaeraceae bacterium]
STAGDATWIHTFFNTQTWTTAGGDFSPTVSSSLNVGTSVQQYTFGSTAQMAADVQAWRDSPDDNFGWILKSDESVSGAAKRFDTRENTTPANRPSLSITFTPPPAWTSPGSGNWSNPANWTTGVPDAVSAGAVLGSAISSAQTVMLDGGATRTVGAITFNNANAYTLAGTGALALNMLSGAAEMNVVAGSHAISVPVTMLDDTNLNITPAGSTLTLSGALTAGGVALTKNGAGTFVAENLRADGLTINDGTVAVSVDGSDAGASRLEALALAGGATPTVLLDLNDNDLILTSNSRATVEGWVASARASGTWKGNGITSSSAKNNASGITTLGVLSGQEYLENSPGAPRFDTFEVADTDALVKYTYYGDSNFDGDITLDDYAFIDGGFLLNFTGWLNGDYDYSGGKPNLDDFALIDGAFLLKSGVLVEALTWLETGGHGSPGEGPALEKLAQHFDQFGAEYATALFASVPEPCAPALLVASVGILTSRRRRQSK